MRPNQNPDLRILHKINPPRAKATIGIKRAKGVCKTPLFQRELFHTSPNFSDKLDRQWAILD
ncbi:hypothetical protein D8674_024938 [Pyrus ussuriensis x Pyrus communis]|uniref:Uncharacterized protein n=1 Tax=Pyrus ussuriensis x Pyrus communis TaxID=2448454 RepID=A0A5N5H4B0_9ROSA|nr:hypothetical protein D8674_024938 [Pyrus ussuriensis x Pyrus communis]